MNSVRSRFTFVELLFSLVILSILASTALPLSEKVILLEKESMLATRLEEIRLAIDRYYDKSGESHYPATLDTLVEEKFLRRVPEDPFTGKPTWRLISSRDAPGQPYTGQDVFDVRSLSVKTSLKGDSYEQW